MRIEINGAYDRILGSFPLKMGSQVATAYYARQGKNRFVAALDIPEAAATEECDLWIEAAKQVRDSDVAKSRDFNIADQIGFRAGKWQGITIQSDELQSITDNYKRLSEYAPDTESERPFLLNHEEAISSKVGRVRNIRQGEENVLFDLTLTAPSAIEEYLCGNYRAISPHLRKNYSFDTGSGTETLPGWTLREISFVTDGGDKKLNLHLKEAKIVGELNKTGDVNTGTNNGDNSKLVLSLSEETVKLREAARVKDAELLLLKEAAAGLEDQKAKLNAQLATQRVDLVMKELVEKKKILPADVPDWTQLVVKMSEEESNAWKARRLQGADVLDTTKHSSDETNENKQNADDVSEDEIKSAFGRAFGEGGMRNA